MAGKTRARRRLRPRTWILIGAGALVVIAAGIVVPLVFLHGGSAAAQARTVTATVGTQTLQKSVSGTGTATPTVNDAVSFTVSGRVTAVNVTAGQTVKAGQVLATVDPLALNAALLTAQADLAQAQATLADAKASSSGSSADVARINADAANVSVRQAAVATAQTNLAAASLTAPNDGLVTAVNIAVGNLVGSGSGSSSSSSTAAFTIVGTGAWMTTVNLSEADVALIKAGNQVEFTTSDSTTKRFGVVRTVGILPSTTSGSAQYPVTVDLTGDTSGLYDGVTLTASIIYERRTDVLAVPSAAVTAGTGGDTVVVVGADGTQTKTPVKVGESDGTYTEITAGLTEGETIVVASFTPGTGNSRTGNGGFGGQITRNSDGSVTLPNGTTIQPGQFGGFGGGTNGGTGTNGGSGTRNGTGGTGTGTNKQGGNG